MTYVVTGHSFRRGTGKSMMLANLATMLALAGHRVGLVDTNFHAPSVHTLFGVQPTEVGLTFNDYLWGRCDLEMCVTDITPRLRLSMSVDGYLYTVFASTRNSEITRMLSGGLYVDLLDTGFQELIEKQALDFLFIDTHAGLNEETLLAVAMADTLIIVLHPDKQDYEGTSIILDVSRQLNVPQIVTIVNEVPASVSLERAQAEVEKKFNCDKALAIAYSDDLMALASNGIFVLRHPDHPISAKFQQIVTWLDANSETIS